MLMNVDDVIAAPATPVGPAARAIIRLSGVSCPMAAESVFQPHDLGKWRTAASASRHRGKVCTQRLSAGIASAAYLWPTTRSYTGQPLVELHIPGSQMLQDEVLAELFRVGARAARPGEFTLRAFLAGRLDLAQAEAVLGVIDASDHSELNLALRQLAGGLSGRLGKVRAELISLLADLEAGLDFVDEDIEFVSRNDVLARLCTAQDIILALVADATERWSSAERLRVVLAGLPNVGKSTLFNAIAGSQRAIVSPKAGTTRDWLTADLEVSGVEIELIDTAGWEKSHDELTLAMQSLRHEQLNLADLILWCLSADATGEDRKIDSQLREQVPALNEKSLFLITKCDVGEYDRCTSIDETSALLQVSGVTGEGLERLQRRIAEKLTNNGSGARQMLGSTAARGRETIQSAADALERSIEAVHLGFGDEIVSAELRLALDGLAAVVGAIYSDEVLDIIFSRFCIGK